MEAKSLPLKIFIDKSSNKVVFAESDRKLVEILLSFLTLPVGAIIHLLDCSSPMESMDNLYKSIIDLDACHFSTSPCKAMLLSPMNNSSPMLQKLEINPDPFSVNDNYCIYPCNRSSESNRSMLSSAKGMLCSCGKCSSGVDIIVKAVSDVLITSCTMFMISDNLRVCEASTAQAVKLLEEAGVAEDCLVSKMVDVQFNQILQLLQRSLCSKSVLSDVFIAECVKDHELFIPFEPPLIVPTSISNEKIEIKLFINKQVGKVLYAEAKEEFIDLLFSFMVFPLGAIMKHLDGLSSLESIDNLYASAKFLSTHETRVIEEKCSPLLLNPTVPPFFNGKHQLIRIEEQAPNRFGLVKESESKPQLICYICKEIGDPLDVEDPKNGGGYVKSDAKFMVTDNLQVTPFSLGSGISYIKDIKIPFDLVEEKIISIGKKEALQMLWLSLFSKTVLTDAFLRKERRRLEIQKAMEGRGLLYAMFALCLVGFD